MNLELPPLDVPQVAQPGRKLTVLQAQLLADGAQCHACPLGRNGTPGKPVATAWNPKRGLPKLALVGEAPGVNECRRGIPFVGASGKLLDVVCRNGGVPRGELAILNAAACGPIPSGADEIKKRTLAACRPRLIAELRRLQPKTVLSLGGLALKSLAPAAPSGITALRGALLEIASDIPIEGWQPLFSSTLHPAHILRGGDGEGPDAPGGEGSRAVDLLYYFLVYDLAKAWRLANGTAKPWRDDCDLFLVHNGQLHRATVDAGGKPIVGDPATAADFVEAMELVRSQAQARGAFACDVETDAKDSLDANLTAIGFATVEGGLSATWSAFQMVPDGLSIARELLASRTLRAVFHNRMYDCVVLPRHGLPVAHPIGDTMLAHHAAFPGLPHKLDAVAQQIIVTPAWKSEWRASTRKEPELVLYNCLHGGTAVVLADGSTKLIEEIVRQRQRVSVLSLGPRGIEVKPVTGWHRKRAPGQSWLRVRTADTRPWSDGLTLTPDHQVYTERGKVRADQLRLDDRIAIRETAFTSEQYQALLGTLLGDSCLHVSPSWRRTPFLASSASLDCVHRADVGWAQEKAALLAPHAILSAERPNRSNFANAAPCRGVRTNNLVQLRELMPLVYDGDFRRRIYTSTLALLGPIGLAWWFMDDGCHQNRKAPRGDSVCFATCNFPREDIDAAVEWFRARYGATTAGKDNVIRVGVRAARVLANEIAPFVIPSLRYKLPRGTIWPEYQRISNQSAPYHARVEAISIYEPTRETRSQRMRADNRYCLTVAGNHNFFVVGGLVANCRDAHATILIEQPILEVVKAHKTERVYEADRQIAGIAQHMREFGFWVDRVEQERQSRVQHSRLNFMLKALAKEFAAIEPRWRERLARNLAVRQRKKDPNDFMERVRIRYNQIARRKKKPTDVGMLKTKAKADLVALFEVLRIPFVAYTAKGAPVTDKKAMETAAAKHPLMRMLIHAREAQHIIATYIDGLPVKRDGRVHPDWSTTKISGRWGAGKSQNIPKQVAGWPPEEEPDPDYLPPLEVVDGRLDPLSPLSEMHGVPVDDQRVARAEREIGDVPLPNVPRATARDVPGGRYDDGSRADTVARTTVVHLKSYLPPLEVSDAPSNDIDRVGSPGGSFDTAGDGAGDGGSGDEDTLRNGTRRCAERPRHVDDRSTTVVHLKSCPPGWETDPSYVYCGRAGKGFKGTYGNPHAVGRCDKCKARHRRTEAIDLFREEALARYASDAEYRTRIEQLRGKRLVCFCAPKPCHCNVYVELLHGPPAVEAVPEAIYAANTLAPRPGFRWKRKKSGDYVCHVPGDRVLTNCGEVPIEDLDSTTHKVIGYAPRSQAVYGWKERKLGGVPFTKHTRSYEGTVVTLSTATGESYTVTQEHVCIAKFNAAATGRHCVYLMRRGDDWRVGRSFIRKELNKKPYVKKDGNPSAIGKFYLGFQQRFLAEAADDLWILGTYPDGVEAALAEETWSLRLRTSKASFVAAPSTWRAAQRTKAAQAQNGKAWVSQAELDAHHRALRQPRAFYASQLEQLGLSIDFPFRTKDRPVAPETWPTPRLTMFVRACNILPEIMSVPVLQPMSIGRKLPHGRTQRAIFLFVEARPSCSYRELVKGVTGEYTRRNYDNCRPAVRALRRDGWLRGRPGAWRTTDRGVDGQANPRSVRWASVQVARRAYAGPVYSLAVARHQTYFAGRIATHNCAVENCRAIITAPTIAEILAHAADVRDVYEDARYAKILLRAQQGFGRIHCGADMNQLELRIAALLGKDPFLLHAYSTGSDVHAMNARVCFPKIFPGLEAEFKAVALGTKYGDAKPLTLKADLSRLDTLDGDACPWCRNAVGSAAAFGEHLTACLPRIRLAKAQKPWSKMRDLAKRLVYAWIYRGRAETAYGSLVKEFPELELSAVIEAFRLLDEKIVGWVAWCNRNEISVRQNREVREALLGRVRLFPLGNYDVNVAVNFPVQCGKFDQRVLTTSGWIELQHLDARRHTLVQKTGVTCAFRVHDTGVQELFRLRTQGRRVTTTANHYYLVSEGPQLVWKPLSSLTVGDWIVVREEAAPADHAPAVPGVGEAQAELIGALFGNGTYNTTCDGLMLATGSVGYANYFDGLLRRALPDLKHVRRGRSPGTFVVATDAKWTKEAVHAWGLPIAAGRAKRLPVWAERAPSPIRRALLRGLFDTDGGFTSGYLVYTTSESANARTIERLLLAEGIDVRLLPLWNTTPHGERRPYWRVRLMPWSVKRFAEIVGFRHPQRARLLATRKMAAPRRPLPPALAAWIGAELRERIARAAVALPRLQHARIHRMIRGSASAEQIERVLAAVGDTVKTTDLRAALAWRYERVEAITRSRTARTYDIEIDGFDHSYVMEGVVTHNCFGASLIIFSLFRYYAVVFPELIESERLYAMDLLDRKWVADRLAEGYGVWAAPPVPIINGHDAITAECDEEDGQSVCTKCGLRGYGVKCVGCDSILPPSRMSKFLELCMDFNITLDGTSMHFFGEAAVGRRLSET